jgi:hypothetical protein
MEKLYVPKYCDSGSILLVNHIGLLRKLFCPFRVKTIVPIGTFKPNMYLWVDEVASNSRDELIYWILGKPYLYFQFEIKASF